MSPQPSSLAAIAGVQIGIMVPRATQVLPATGSQNLFISTGPVLLTGLLGRITTATDATACNLKAYIGVAGTTDICAVVACASQTLGSLFYITGVFATALAIAIAAGPPISLATMGHGLQINQILWESGLNLGINTSGTNLGAVQWTCFYVPLAADAAVNVV